jgi:hypothetical protein
VEEPLAELEEVQLVEDVFLDEEAEETPEVLDVDGVLVKVDILY